MRIVVKIGSNVLTRADGSVDTTRISSLVDQVMSLRGMGHEVVIVSSGAVASGRSQIRANRKLDGVSARQLYSAVGQVRLLNLYWELFRSYGVVCGQVLTTKEDFSNRTGYLNQKNCLEVMLAAGVVPIVNENDTISVTELMFTDNDELSGLIATMIRARELVILTNVDGVYDGNPADPASRVIRRVECGVSLEQYVVTGGSSFGRGGMITKSRTAQKLAAEGVEVVIANGKRADILIELFDEQTGGDAICTRFAPCDSPVSSVKKWIAHSGSFSRGELHVNSGAVEALSSERATSLLAVGIERVEGMFDKDDIVSIITPEGECLGVGRVSYNNEQLSLLCGAQGVKPVIHYDYLFIQ